MQHFSLRLSLQERLSTNRVAQASTLWIEFWLLGTGWKAAPSSQNSSCGLKKQLTQRNIIAHPDIKDVGEIRRKNA
jgi:hypothetical protein